MAKKAAVKFTANFERDLHEIERFLIAAGAAQEFDGLPDELPDTVIPNLERFPAMARPFLRQRVGSVEASMAVATLTEKLAALTPETDAIREYVLKHYLMLYAVVGGTVCLLAIRHQRQLSFDFEGHWQR